MHDGLPYSRLVSFNEGAPDGALSWVLRAVDGRQITSGSITPPNGAVSTVIVVAAEHNTLQPSDPLRVTRDLSWYYLVNGQTRSGRERYFVEGSVPFPVSETGVRNLLGAPGHNLPDQEIDLISAYWGLRSIVGESQLLAFEGEDGEDATVIARGIEAKAALAVLPTLPLRIAQKETSGTDSYSRHEMDWVKLETKLYDLVNAAVTLVDGPIEVVTGSIFGLSTPVDRFNP